MLDGNSSKLLRGLLAIAFIGALIQVFDTIPSSSTLQGCQYTLGVAGATGYLLFVIVYNVFGIVMYAGFLTSLKTDDNVPDLLTNMARRTKLAFYVTFLTSLICDVTYLFIYYVFESFYFVDGQDAVVGKKGIVLGDLFYLADTFTNAVMMIYALYPGISFVEFYRPVLGTLRLRCCDTETSAVQLKDVEPQQLPVLVSHSAEKDNNDVALAAEEESQL